MPTLTLGTSAAAVVVGFISMTANLAGYVGNHAIGWLRDGGLGDGSCLLLLAACYVVGGLFVSAVKVPRSHSPRA